MRSLAPGTPLEEMVYCTVCGFIASRQQHNALSSLYDGEGLANAFCWSCEEADKINVKDPKMGVLRYLPYPLQLTFDEGEEV